MKIIDLLNKINNNEEVPKKVKFGNTIFRYSETKKEYIHDIDDWHGESLLYRVMNTHFISDLLKAEVEVIKENKEIKEFKTEYTMRNMDMQFQNKMNEIIRAVNKLNKDLEKLQTLNIEIDEETINNAIKRARNYLKGEENKNEI